MCERLDILEYTPLVHKLIRNWKVPEQEAEDYYQDFYLYFDKYKAHKYDKEKGKPTTYITLTFQSFINNIHRKANRSKNKGLKEALEIESRDKEFLDRELGSYMTDFSDDVYVEELLEGIDPLSLNLLLGNVTQGEQAKKEGITRQGVSVRLRRKLDELIKDK